MAHLDDWDQVLVLQFHAILTGLEAICTGTSDGSFVMSYRHEEAADESLEDGYGDA